MKLTTMKGNMAKIRLLIAIIILLFLAVGVWWGVNYLGLLSKQSVNGQTTGGLGALLKTNPLSSSLNGETNSAAVPLQLEVVAENLFVPWSIVFTSKERMLVTERNGQVRQITNGQLQSEPVHAFSEITQEDEDGLMGMTLDPNYQTNKYLYFAMSYPKNGDVVVKVERWTDQGSSLNGRQTIIDDIPGAHFHAGCRIKFGPDGKLYITTGDATNKNLAQDKSSVGGKILRINADGSIPADNPFPNSPVYSLGHRNPQGIDWHPETGMLVQTEHGPSIFDGPAGGDELNIIKPGQNYGWPVVSHDKNRPEFVAPKIVFEVGTAPAAGHFYKSDAIPQFKNAYLIGALKGAALIKVTFDPNNPEQVWGYEKVSEVNVGRVREVTEGPDGFVYITSSNRDGRGKPNTGDDKIYRLRPVN